MIEVVVDLGAYRRNIARLTERVIPARLMAMVKADAYGHGLVRMAQEAVASGVRLIGVLDPRSGLILRERGIGPQVRLFAWLFDAGEDFRPLVDAGIDLGVSHRGELDRIAAAGSDRAAVVHLKLDTGLHRNGASEQDWPGLVRRAVELRDSGAVVLGGVWTHIGEASDDDDTAAIERFHRGITTAEALGAAFELRHLAASAAGSARTDARFDAVRIGAFTYGIAPGSGVGPADVGIEPVMTFSATVTGVRGGLASVSAGYLDGVPQHAAERAEVTIRGRRHAVISVGAARLEVAVAEGTDVVAGDAVTLFGSGRDGEATLQEWADALGTIGEELVVRIPARIPRRYVG